MLLSLFYYFCLVIPVVIILALLNEKSNKQPYKAIVKAILLITLF